MTCEDCGTKVKGDGAWITCLGCNARVCTHACAYYYSKGEIEAYCDRCVTSYNLTLNSEVMLPPFERGQGAA